MSYSFDPSAVEIARIEGDIAKLQTKLETVKRNAALASEFYLTELKNCQFRVWERAVSVIPSEVMAARLPQPSSQLSFDIPLGDGFTLHVSDYGVILWGLEHENVEGRLRWLRGLGVVADAVTVDPDAYGSVKHALLQLEQARKNHANAENLISKVFTS